MQPVSSVSARVGASVVPETVRHHCTFADPDYVDCYTIELPDAPQADPESWARAVLEEAPLSRRSARRLWRLIGLRLGPAHAHDHIQGWKIADQGHNWLLLQTTSCYLSAEAVCVVEDETVSISVSLRFDRPPAALVWALVSRAHQRAVPVMLHQAAELMTC